MFRSLRRQLVFLYGFTSSVILSIIMVGIGLFNMSMEQTHTREMFQNNVEQIAEKIRSENRINSTWVTEITDQNNMIVYIENNGILLSRFGNHGTEEDKFLPKLRQEAEKEGIYSDRKPIQSSIEKSSIFNLGYHKLEACFGMTIVVSQDTGWISIMAVYDEEEKSSAVLKQVILYLFVTIWGIAALFLVSSVYIRKVLTPLEEGQKKQNEFVAAASHELRSPLTVIKAGLSSIREDSSKVNQFLPPIERECERMTRLLSDMLLLAAADAKTWTLDNRLIEMDTLMIECYDMLCNLCNQKNYNLLLEVPEDEFHPIHGDAERIKQVITILVDNAMSYSKDGSNITLRALNDKHFVQVEVEDHGVGIPEEEKEHIYDRFYRADKARNNKKHFGLGLSIAKELIELQGGNISAQDTQGGGTTFVLRLPY